LFQDLARTGAHFLKTNAPALLTGVGVVGTAGTGILAARGAFKAAKLVDAEERKVRLEQDGLGGLDSLDKVKLAWPLFLPAAGTGLLTITSIVAAHRVSSSQVAAMATLYGLTDERFKEYREQVAKQMGITKEQKVQDATQAQLLKKNGGYANIVLAEGDVMCYDAYSARYFRSSMERIKKAENKLNAEIFHHDYVSLTQFYEDIGIEQTGFSDEVGWNTNHAPIEIRYTTEFTPDDKPCIAIDFNVGPKTDYNRIW